MNPKAKKEYNEVLALLELIPSYDYLKIPSEKISFLKKNCVEGYKIDISDIENTKISKNAYSIFIKLYKEYIAMPEEKKKLEEILILNDKINKERYDIVFKNEEKKEKNANNYLLEIKRKSFFESILSKIKRFFRK